MVEVDAEPTHAAAAHEPVERRDRPPLPPRQLAIAALCLATGALAAKVVSAVLARVGHPAPTLDDAYIHLQYARAIAEGHPFRYQAGEPISTGATSFLWPLVLAPFHLLGVRGASLVWVAWAFGFTALAALAYEVAALTRPLAGRTSAIGAAAMTLSFGGLAWSAASGMEVVPFAWLLARALRRGADWAEADAAQRTWRRLRELIALAIVLPLARPEGALFALALGGVVLASPPPASWRRRVVVSTAFVASALLPQLLVFLLTGSPTSSTAEVKLLAFQPYLPARVGFVENVRLLFETLLDGEIWSAEFVPSGGRWVALGGLAACAFQTWSTRRWTRGALVLLLALGMLVPCAYATFLWNRLRYLWPFAPGWIVGLACLARVVGKAARAARLPGAATFPALIVGAFVGLFASKVGGVIDDVAQSASGIDRQQAQLGRWVDENLPREAIVGVNDTGAIAYFGRRRTFDVVGLTTPGEGRYWVAGAASRYEHYERLARVAPERLPTHFVVYPEWMACEPVLGRMLTEAVVRDATILGGQVMRAYEARWEVLGHGEAPWTPHVQTLDALDVADLESEAEHAYDLRGAREGEQRVEETVAPDGDRVVVDGARTNRTSDRFVLRPGGGTGVTRLVARVSAAAPTQLVASVGGAAAGARDIGPGEIVELSFDDVAAPPEASVEVRAEGAPFASYHYWLVRPQAP